MALEACCYSNGACSNLEPEECVALGGLPRGQNTYCVGTVPPPGSPTRIDCRYQACCFQVDPSREWRCLDTTPHNCETAADGTPMGIGTRCVEGFNCADLYDNTRCCLADGSDLTTLSADQCTAIGGTPVMLDDECPTVEPDEQCRYAEPDRLPEGALHWHRDVCQNAMLTPTRRHETQVPDAHEPGFIYYRPGYFELVTQRRVRAMALAQNDPSEPCRHQFAPMTVGDDGYAEGLLCGDRAIEGLSRSSTVPIIAPETDEFGPAGYARFVGAYQAPLWTEAIFDSPLLTCGGAPV